MRAPASDVAAAGASLVEPRLATPCDPAPVPGAYVVRVTPSDVGQRVTLRLRTGDEAQPLTDVVGTLRAWAGRVLEVERRDGTLTTVAESDLVAAKVLPPAPVRTPRVRGPDA